MFHRSKENIFENEGNADHKKQDFFHLKILFVQDSRYQKELSESSIASFSEFGTVNYLYIDINDGYVTSYLEMDSELAMEKVAALLIKGLFNGRMIIPFYLSETDFLKATNGRKRNSTD